MSATAVIVLFLRLCPVDGIFTVVPPVGDVHEVVKCLGLDAPKFLLEVLALDAVLEGIDGPFFGDVRRGVLGVGPTQYVRANGFARSLSTGSQLLDRGGPLAGAFEVSDETVCQLLPTSDGS